MKFRLLPSFLLLAAFTLSPAPAAASQPSSGFADQAFNRINQERSSAGVAPLRRSYSAELTAQMHAMDMANREYMAHITQSSPGPVTPDPEGHPSIQFTGGMDPGGRLRACGFTQGGGWGENIAWNLGYGSGSPAAAVSWWMGSPPHRENLLRSGFTAAGMGAAVSRSGKVYYAQVFLFSAGSDPTIGGNAGLWSGGGGGGDPEPEVDETAPADWDRFKAKKKKKVGASFKVKARDFGSGMDTASGAFRYSQDGGTTWSAWQAAAVSGRQGSSAGTLSTPPVTLNLAAAGNRVQFRVEDVAGNLGVSPVFSVPQKAE